MYKQLQASQEALTYLPSLWPASIRNAYEPSDAYGFDTTKVSNLMQCSSRVPMLYRYSKPNKLQHQKEWKKQ